MAYDIETIIWTAALLAAVTALVWFGRAMRRHIRHGGNLDAMPDELSGEGTLGGAGFAGKRSTLGSDLIRAATALPEEERDIVHHALWHAMLLEAASDGSVDPREIRFVAEFFASLSGRKLGADGALEAAGHIAANPRRTLREIAKARGASAGSRRCIVESAMLVSLADGDLIESEANRLGDIADALGFGIDERRAIYAGMTERLRT